MSENIKDGYAICFNRWLFDDRIRAQLPLLLLISSLSAKEGYCYASNQYFAEKFKTSSVTVSKWISELKKYGYIETEDEKFGAVVTNRKIRIVDLAVKENFNGDYRPEETAIKENDNAVSENFNGDYRKVNPAVKENFNGYYRPEETAIKENDNAVSENFNGDYRKVNPAVKENFNGYNMCNNTSHNITSQEYYKPLKSSSLSLANARTREAIPTDDFSQSDNFSPPVREPAKKFQKPTIEQIKAYCLEAGKNIDAEAFFDFYEAKGWVVGRAPMKDWKAAVRNWAKNESQFLRRRSNDKEDEYADVPMFASDNPILKNNFLSRDMSVIYDRAAQIAIEDERLRSSPAQIEIKDHR